jgi:DNA primase catalytic core
MARVPEAELERLKAEVSLQRLVEAKGVELRRHGARDLVGCCPFHDDREPSLVVSPSKNLWHCMGACQTGGSVVDWVMRAEGVSFRHAVELLRADLPAGAISPHVVRDSTVRRLPAPVEFDADDQELLRQVADYYHETLRRSPEAQAYLERRGLASAEAVATFRLGFANRTLGLRLPEKNRRAGADMRTRLQRLGIMRQSGHEHFNGSLVVPVYDEAGSITEIYGRKLRDDLRTGTPTHLYLPGPHRGVWNVAALAGSEEVIVCEALLDALTFWVHGFRSVTAAYGVEGFTADHLAAFQRHGVRRALIAYDRDAAGDRAAVQLAVRLVGAGVDCYRVHFPQGQDANGYAGADLATAPERLARLLRSAVWLGKGRPPERPPLPISAPVPGAGRAAFEASTPLLGAAAGDLHDAGLRRAGRRRRGDPARPRPPAAALRRPRRGAGPRGVGAAGAGGGAERGGAGRRAGVAARPGAAAASSWRP